MTPKEVFPTWMEKLPLSLEQSTYYLHQPRTYINQISFSAGLGYENTTELAKHGAKVYLAARSESKAQAAIEKLYSEHPNIKKGNLIFLPLDLADLDSVVNAVESFTSQEQRLDILSK
jgi:enoyl-[acyl-carrier-protein] reductase (NADH)